MERAMAEVGLTAGLRRELAQAFARTADHMRNVPE
jgi:truncated hemoglobin YjbI